MSEEQNIIQCINYMGKNICETFDKKIQDLRFTISEERARKVSLSARCLRCISIYFYLTGIIFTLTFWSLFILGLFLIK